MGATEWDDHHGILPECFKREYGGCQSVDEALRVAENEPSTTPEDERRRCPVCGSRRLRRKTASRDTPNARPEDWKCTSCYWHFDNPITPNDPDTMHGTATHDDRKPFDWMNSNRLEDPDERAPALSQLDDETLTALAIRAYEPWSDGGRSYSEIAAVLPYSRWWVGERVRGWKRGEYRDLVADPREQPSVDVTADGSTAVADGGTEKNRWSAYGSD